MPRSLLLTILLFVVFAAQSQKILTTLDIYNKEFVPEKIHVHFGKNAYSAGETIWFKAYVLEGILPTTISTNFYAELIDHSGKVIHQKIIPVFLSTAAGSFDIPLDWKGDGLLFRGYTSWMLNFDSSFLYSKNISINTSTSKTKTYTRQVDLRFFPEGGDLVEGIESVIAFKATDQYGLPVSINGVIKSGTGETIQSFQSVHDGMGRIKLKPLPNTSYYAEWNAGSEVKKVDLPAAKKSGVVLVVSENADNVVITVEKTTNATALNAIQVVAQMHQQVVYKAKINLSKSNKGTARIPKNALISGNLMITLFDESWQPLAERIKFVNNNDFSFDANVNLTKKDLKKRGLNEVEVEIPDTLFSNLSLSVTDEQLESNNATESIISKLLLTSDIRGYVHKPAYYFSNTSDSVKEHLDLVLLTNGWRKYDWQSLAQGILPHIKHKKENYLTLSGTIIGVNPNQIPKGTQVNLIMLKKDSTRQYINAPVNEKGNFYVDKMVFFDTVQLYYQFNGKSYLNERATVEINKKLLQLPPVSSPARHLLQWPYLTNERSQFFAQKTAEVLPLFQNTNENLEEVIIRTKARSREQELEKEYTSGLFQAGRSQNFNIIDDGAAPSYLNVFEYLQSRVAGLIINQNDGAYEIQRRQFVPQLFLNEIAATAEQLQEISMSEVVYIKVIDPPFIGGSGNGPGGAIAVYTKKGGESFKNGQQNKSFTRVAGYDMPKEFYSPDYATASPLHKIEDVRSTLYWQPYVLTNKANRKVKLQFYNNDVSSSFKVVLEGMNEEGRLVRIEKLIR
jgi:hypothetical protein